jgi:hypothetical protein
MRLSMIAEAKLRQITLTEAKIRYYKDVTLCENYV